MILPEDKRIARALCIAVCVFFSHHHVTKKITERAPEVLIDDGMPKEIIVQQK